MAKKMSEETKAKIKAAHKKRAQDPLVLQRLRDIAQDPVNKEKRSAAMKAKWADPVWRTAQLAKKKASREAKAADEAQAEADRTTPAEKAAAEANEAPALVEVAPGDNPNIPTEADLTGVPAEEVKAPAKAKKKRVITPEQKAKYAANRKAKRDAAKATA